MAFSCLPFLVLTIPIILATSEPNQYKPEILSQLTEKNKPAFHGEIFEDEQIVSLRPPLAAMDNDKFGSGLICSYKIKRNENHPQTKPLPFDIVVTDRQTGAAEVRVRQGLQLSHEGHPYYKFGIMAQDCGGRNSKKAYMSIKVLPSKKKSPAATDKFAPKFDNETYFASVEEGKMVDSIVRIHASDQDQTTAFSTICKYDLMTRDAPFEITTSGDLRNTEPLDYSIHRNFILEVIAQDCGGRRSEPVFVNLVVKEKCHSGWSGLKDEVQYRAGSGQVRVAGSAQLSLCAGDCTPEQLVVKLRLTTGHIGKGCDRDTYSVNSQRKLCGASGASVDLLPSPTSSSWSHNIPTDDGHEMDQVFAFDGEDTALEVPEAVFNHMLHKHFTISAWLRHKPTPSSSQAKAPKEHVLCMSDGEGMSRHHYGLYIHGAKLVLLLRREAEDVTSEDDMEVFRPAEFRWTVSEINDDRWHHYAVNVDQDDDAGDGGVKLFIDGKLLPTTEDNFEIIDDWPLHQTKRVHSTKLVVGGCWQGKDQTFAHYFNGYMAGLFVLRGKTESERVIRCLNSCKENLDFHAVSDMSAGTSVSFNSDLTEFTISSRSVSEVNQLIGQVAYVNARTFPTPGHRKLTLETSLMCSGETVVLPVRETRVMVHEQQEPLFVISGYSNLTRMVYEFERGLRIFHDIRIFAKTQQDGEDDDDDDDDDDDNDIDDTAKAAKLAKKLSKTLMQQSTSPKDGTEFMIDECHVKADPPLNLFIEHLNLPVKLMKSHGMEWMETNDGVDIRNADSISNYEEVIRSIHYFHSEPTKLTNRTLTLYCSSQNHRFTSTKFIERLVALHQAPPAPAHMQSNSQSLSQSLDQSGGAQGAMATSNLGMAAIIVVCVGFLLFMIILGVFRIRAAHHRTQVLKVPGEEEMEWDNSGLNITVNPMETEMFEYEDNRASTFPEDSDSEEESSLQGDYGDSTEDEEPVVRGGAAARGDLEWDHTTI